MNLDDQPPIVRLPHIVLLAILIAGGCTHTGEQAGPAPTSVDQHAQSPIDLPEQADVPTQRRRVELHYHETAEHIIHREHTIELDIDDNDDNGIEFDGKNYLVQQFHLHTPSEHLIGGHRYPAELHIVHRGPQGEILVVGILYSMGTKSSFLEQILIATPEELGRVDRDVSLDISDLIPSNSHFYSYRGSFTTPPYTEGVEWLILRSHPEASAEQIVRLLVLEGGNARQVQEKNGRKIAGF